MRLFGGLVSEFQGLGSGGFGFSSVGFSGLRFGVYSF